MSLRKPNSVISFLQKEPAATFSLCNVNRFRFDPRSMFHLHEQTHQRHEKSNCTYTTHFVKCGRYEHANGRSNSDMMWPRQWVQYHCSSGMPRLPRHAGPGRKSKLSNHNFNIHIFASCCIVIIKIIFIVEFVRYSIRYVLHYHRRHIDEISLRRCTYLITAQGKCSITYSFLLLGIPSRLHTEYQNIVYVVKARH
jgi:hypothetical protein